MSTPYPAALDDSSTLPNPSAGNPPNNPSHSGLHTNAQDSIKAIEAKLGTGASTPTNNFFLVGTGAGTSAWTKASPTGAVLGTTDSQSVSNKAFTTSTWTGGTISNPVLNVDTISGYTVSGNGTIYGMTITGGTIGTNALANTSVTASKLSTGAAANNTATGNSTTASTSYVATLADAVTTSVTVTIGANGLALVIISAYIFNTATATNFLSFSVTGANTIAASDNNGAQMKMNSSDSTYGAPILLTGLTAGSTTFTLNYRTTAGTATFGVRRLAVVPL